MPIVVAGLLHEDDVALAQRDAKLAREIPAGAVIGEPAKDADGHTERKRQPSSSRSIAISRDSIRLPSRFVLITNSSRLPLRTREESHSASSSNTAAVVPFGSSMMFGSSALKIAPGMTSPPCAGYTGMVK